MAHTTFGLIRHAETHWNRAKVIQGQTDTDLTPEGEAAARSWGAALAAMGWDGLLASDLTRARRTAALVNESLGLPIHTDPRLREQDWGRWVGRTVAQLRADEAGEVERQEAAGWGFRPTDGEDRREVLARALDALLDAHGRAPGRRLLVVTHGGVIKCVTNHLLGLDFLPEEGNPLRPYHLHRVACDGAAFSLQTLNVSLQRSAGDSPMTGEPPA